MRPCMKPSILGFSGSNNSEPHPNKIHGMEHERLNDDKLIHMSMKIFKDSIEALNLQHVVIIKPYKPRISSAIPREIHVTIRHVVMSVTIRNWPRRVGCGHPARPISLVPASSRHSQAWILERPNMAMGQNRGTLVSIKIDGKWMLIHPSMVP